METLIYCVRNNKNGKVYIGQTRRIRPNDNVCTDWAVYKRWKEHVRASRCPGVNVFHNAIKDYGFKSFTIKIIDGCPTSVANDLETSYIDHYDSVANGYNSHRGSGRSKIELPYAHGCQRQLIQDYNRLLDRKLGQVEHKWWRRWINRLLSWF